MLVEVEDFEAERDEQGFEEVSIFRDGRKAVVMATVSFDDAVRNVVSRNVQALTSALKKLERPPSEVEMTFSLKATAEVGNIAIAKAGGEANFEVKLTWKTDGGGSA